MDITALMKPHFMLSRMHIDIDLMRIEFEHQHIASLSAGNVLGEGLSNGMIDESVANQSAIHIEILGVTGRALEVGRLYIT